MSQFPPTPEQQVALDLFATGESLAIEAGAGTGKTATLEILAGSTKRRGQYIAFNKAIVDEAGERMPGNVAANTAHSLAFRAVGHKYLPRLKASQRMRSKEIARRLKIDGIKVRQFDGEDKFLSSTFLAGLAMKGVTRFCQSADPEPTMWHVPYVPGLDPPATDDGGHRRNVVNKQVAKYLEPAMRRAWRDLADLEGGLPYQHDHYLKLWQLSEPRIGADFILFDEAQDANPVMVAIVAAQTHAQLVWVGDSQQQIYTFTGAVNALAKVGATNRAFLTQSFRFGPAVADVANSVLARLPDAELRLRGFDEIASTVGPVAVPDVVLTRTNATAVRTVLERRAAGLRVHLVGGGGDVVEFAKAAGELMETGSTEYPDLACFDSWGEVQEYVDQDELGAELRLNVKLVDEFTVPVIVEALGQRVPERDADLVVSTAHKSKGRQWGSVQLAGDFPEESKITPEELRLLYVAVTRAQRELDIDAVPVVRDGYHGVPPVVATTAADSKALSQPEPAGGEIPLEVVPDPVSEHWGAVGDVFSGVLSVDRVAAQPTKYGSWLTGLVDDDGNVFKWFADERFTVGDRLEGSWTVKAHGEWRDVKETTLYRAVGVRVAVEVKS